MAENTENMEQKITQNVILYLSNLFSSFEFKNLNEEDNIITRETSKYFDTLRFSGDDWIKFDTNADEPSSINIKHAIYDKDGNYDDAGHVNPTILEKSLLEFTDDDEGNITISYIAQTKNQQGGS